MGSVGPSPESEKSRKVANPSTRGQSFRKSQGNVRQGTGSSNVSPSSFIVNGINEEKTECIVHKLNNTNIQKTHLQIMTLYIFYFFLLFNSKISVA